MKKRIILFLSICLLVLIWQCIALYVGQPKLIPSIPGVIEALFHLFSSDLFYKSLFATVLRGIVGMCLSLTAALLSAFLFARYEIIHELFKPALIIMRSVPVISFILLALIFFNPEGIPLMIAFLTMYPLLTENLTKGIINLRPGLSVMAKQFGINRLNRFTQIIYPQIKPFLFSGLASAAGFGWRAIIMGEVLSQCAFGIGGEMKRAQNFIEVPELIAWTVIAVGISFLSDKCISSISKIQWKIAFRKGSQEPTDHKKQKSFAIHIYDISFNYGETIVFNGFSCAFDPEKIYGIKAASGTGKTTLLNLIGGSLKAERGNITIDRTYGIPMVFQEPELLSQLTALENIYLPLVSFYNKTQAIEEARKTLNLIEMDLFQNRYPSQLSFGQQQRIAIARALAYPSPVLLMDEPFKGLDEPLTYRIINRIKMWQKETGKLILFTSHNPGELSLLATEIIELPFSTKLLPDHKE